MKRHYFSILVFATVALGGCVLPYTGSVRQISYRVQFQKPVEIDYDSAVQFADDFAIKAGMGITYISPQTGSPSRDDVIDICLGDGKPTHISDLFRESGRPITAGVIACKSTDTIDISIEGDIDSPSAKEIALKGINLFHEKYPNGIITPTSSYAHKLLGF
jgi:hypothetical protein